MKLPVFVSPAVVAAVCLCIALAGAYVLISNIHPQEYLTSELQKKIQPWPSDGRSNSNEAPAPQSGSNSSAIHLPGAETQKLYVTISSRCEKNAGTCYTDGLKDITQHYGPTAALEVLAKLQHSGLITASTDDHQLAHVVGRKTAEKFGVNGEAFLLCPTSFNYGCQHGYFEYALGRSVSSKEVIKAICGGFEASSSYSAKFKFYCYHGVGHGVMMSQAYDLGASIKICDSLDSHVATDGCWQGVFMENVNAAMRGEARPGIFSEKNPLAPCDTVSDQYRHECFINHAGWLMHVFQNDVRRASASCLQAPLGWANSCLQSIGLMVTNPVWQSQLAPTPPAPTVPSGPAGGSRSSPEELAWNICQEFPAEGRSQCVIGGVDNILNFDELKVARAGSFCWLVDPAYQEVCFQRIGANIASQAIDPRTIRERCSEFASRFRDLCLRAAGLQ